MVCLRGAFFHMDNIFVMTEGVVFDLSWLHLVRLC